MLIDDDEISNFIAEKQLRRLDVFDNIIVALNGLEAQHYIQNSAELPQVALVDINMPLMNGFEFMDWFEQSQFKGHCKFFFYSTSIRSEDRKQASAFSDVIDYIEKPLTEEKVQKIVRMFLGGKDAAR